jgi:hypothetical protein
MGCKGSKLDNQEAVALCRGRADLLAAAVRHRYALADAHGDLADSLASVAAALHILMTASSATHPTLALPADRKDADAPAPPPPLQQPNSSTPHPSSHIDFATSSDSESSSAASSPRLSAGRDRLLHQHHPPSALPYPHYGYAGYGYADETLFGVYPQRSLRLSYSRNRPPPSSVAVEQRAVAPERVYFGYSETAPRGYPPPQYQYYGEPVRASRTPPPSPPRESTWDFFNFFADYDVYDNYCYDTGGAAAVYTPSRRSRGVREEEGIPELEDEDVVVVKQVDSEYHAPGGGARSRHSSLGGGVSVSSGVAEVDRKENSVVDKEVVGRGNVAHQPATTQRNVAAPAPAAARGPIPEGSDVASQIKRQFVRASDAVRAVAPILEVGRRRHHPRSSVYHGEPVCSSLNLHVLCLLVANASWY